MAKKYIPTIGLEIHAELSTLTKMFCNSKNNPDEKSPNKNICPICVGYPGTLPTINKEAVKKVLKVGSAINGELADFTEFDRKNYFYPDIPKGYQISQYKFPLVKGGELNGVQITRVHLEEDTAKSSHVEGENYSLIDFNRAGVPLMELVTEPDIETAEEAVAFAKELQLLLRYLGVSDADMEKGHMRIEANVSVGESKKEGTKVEVKNLNSFRAVERAIKFEIERQVSALEDGGEVVQETRGWNEMKEETFSQRKKEESHDYRYFPEPDLPKLYISKIPEFSQDNLKREQPELPKEKRTRYLEVLGLKEEVADIFIQSEQKDKVFRDAISGNEESKEVVSSVANLISVEIPAIEKKLKDEGGTPKELAFNPQSLAILVLMKIQGEISSRGVKEILYKLVSEGGDPENIAKENNLIQKGDEGEIREVVKKIISQNPKVADDFRSGKETVLQYLIGQGMKETKGSANPEILKTIFISELKK